MDNKTGLVSIILLNYNGKQFNSDCIDSILKQTYHDYEIIFVDNKSTDGSLEDVEKCYKKEIESGKIKIVKNNENLWFAGGNNIGVKFSSKKSKYIRLLNNDTIIDQECLYELVKGLESDDELGAVSSVILDKGDETKIKQMTENGMVKSMNIFGLLLREKAIRKNDILYTNFCSGCSFLYKKSIIELPFFDFYKIYAEDVQLSRELMLKGFKLGVCKNSFVYHYGSATMKKMPYKKVYLDTRNLMLNFTAFLGRSSRIKLFIPRIIFYILYIIINRSDIRTYTRAIRNSTIWIKNNKNYINIVKKRINKGRKIGEKEFISMISYKLVADNTSNYNGLKQKLINALNFLNRLYYKVFGII